MGDATKPITPEELEGLASEAEYGQSCLMCVGALRQAAATIRSLEKRVPLPEGFEVAHAFRYRDSMNLAVYCEGGNPNRLVWYAWKGLGESPPSSADVYYKTHPTPEAAIRAAEERETPEPPEEAP